MRLDRVVEDIFILISEQYAQVTCTVLLTDQGAIVVDTLPFPSETREAIAFIERKLGADAVRYVINTHYHADHTYGTCFFDGAEVVAQEGCRAMLERVGGVILERAKRETPALAEVELRLPNVTFQGEMHLHVGHRHLQLMHTPGHTADCISVYVPDEKVLIAGDTVMPVPHIVGGSDIDLGRSLLQLRALNAGFIVQGHGDVLLRGEIEETLDSSIQYLEIIAERVKTIVRRGDPPARLREIDIEACGKSRIPLDGLVSRLHLDNLVALYKAYTAQGLNLK